MSTELVKIDNTITPDILESQIWGRLGNHQCIKCDGNSEDTPTLVIGYNKENQRSIAFQCPFIEFKKWKSFKIHFLEVSIKTLFLENYLVISCTIANLNNEFNRFIQSVISEFYKQGSNNLYNIMVQSRTHWISIIEQKLKGD